MTASFDSEFGVFGRNFSQCIASNKNCNSECSKVKLCSRLTKWRTKTITNDSCFCCCRCLVNQFSSQLPQTQTQTRIPIGGVVSLSFVAVAVCCWFHLFKIPFEKFKPTANWHPLAHEWINDRRRLVWQDFFLSKNKRDKDQTNGCGTFSDNVYYQQTGKTDKEKRR